MKPYLALIRNDIRLAFRQKTVIFFNYVMPLAFFFIFGQSSHAERGGAIRQIVAMVTVIGILGNGLFGAGMRAVQDREANILRRFKVAPISPLPLLVAATVTGLVVYIPLLFMMMGLANRMYGMEVPSNSAAILLFIVLGVIAIRSIGLIIAAVVNSMQESGIIIQIVYMTMLFLSGTTFPPSMFPGWLQTVMQFIPSTWVYTGLQGLLVKNESLATNWQAVIAMLLTTAVGMLLSVKLFRWEKEEKLRPAAKLWILAVLLPFTLLGAWQIHAKDNIRKTLVIEREISRSQSYLIRNARIITGTGRAIENGAVLIRHGEIAEVYDGNIPDEQSVKAQPIEAAGKTIMPGLIDTHVHLASPGGFMDDWSKYDAAKAIRRNLAAYLYTGITTVRSAGDPLDMVLSARDLIASGEKLGAQVFLSGPIFTTAGGHGTEILKNLPEQNRTAVEAQMLRLPATADEARQSVDALKQQNVDCIKIVLDAGAGGAVYNRLDVALLNAIAAEARAKGLPVIVHTSDARDVEDALRAGASGIEHGSFRQRIPDEAFALMAKNGVTYDPTLSVGEAVPEFAAGKMDLINRSLVQQVVPKEILAATRKMLQSPESAAVRKGIGDSPIDMAIARDNLLRAWKAGVTLVTGSDAGNMLVFHGPTVQHELQLWVQAGIPPDVALIAATSGAAKALHADKLGSVAKGKTANLLVVDGNPLEDIRATEAISFVIYHGERINRGELFEQAK